MIPDRLQTANLSFRPFTTNDDRAVLDYWQSDPAWERFNASVPQQFTLADAADFIEGLRTRTRNRSPSWALLHDGEVIGVVSLTFEQNHRIAVIGYGLHAKLRGRGLAAEAASKIIAEAFDRYTCLNKLRAHTDARNAPSIRVLEKLGFQHEGTLRANQYAKGRYVDEAIYGLLRKEWCISADEPEPAAS